MAFFSQYAGGTDTYRLKLKNGPYLDEVVPSSSNHHIRDFTAQNDHLMISMTNGKVYVAERNNELLECLPNNADLFSNPSNYDLLIGGDPFVSDVMKLTSAIAYFNNTTTDAIRNSSYGPTHRTIYYTPSSPITVSSSNNSSTSTLTNSIRRFMYAGGELFYFYWSASTGELKVFEVNHVTGLWSIVDLDSVTTTFAPVAGATTIDFSGIVGCTYPEIDHRSGNIIMFFAATVEGFKLEYNINSGLWSCGGVNGLEGGEMSTGPSSLAIGTNEMMITSTVSSATKYLSGNTDGLAWLSITNSNEWNFKECGFANGKFYSIVNEGSGSVGSSYSGVLMSLNSDPSNSAFWQYENTPEVPAVKYIRNNGLGTACYISTGYHSSTNTNQSFHAIKRIT